MTWSVTFEGVISFFLALLTIGVGIIFALIRIIYVSLTARMDRFEQHVQARLRSLGHEDRDIRNQIQGVAKLFFEAFRKSN